MATIQPNSDLDPATVARLKSDPEALRQFYDSLTPEQRAAYAPLPSSSSVGDDGSISVSYGPPPQAPSPLTLASPASATGNPVLGDDSPAGGPAGALDFSQFVPPDKRAEFQASANGLAPARTPPTVQPVPYGKSAGASARTPASNLDFSGFVPPENLAAFQATNSGAMPQASDAQAAPAPSVPIPQTESAPALSTDASSSYAVPQPQTFEQAMQQWKLGRIASSLNGSFQPAEMVSRSFGGTEDAAGSAAGGILNWWNSLETPLGGSELARQPQPEESAVQQGLWTDAGLPDSGYLPFTPALPDATGKTVSGALGGAAQGWVAVASGLAQQMGHINAGLARLANYAGLASPQDAQNAEWTAQEQDRRLFQIAQNVAQYVGPDPNNPFSRFGNGIGRSAVGVAPFFINPALGFATSAAEAGGEARQQAAAAGLSPAEQDKAANAAEVKALFLNAAFMRGGVVAGRGVSAMLGKEAPLALKVAAGAGTAGTLNELTAAGQAAYNAPAGQRASAAARAASDPETLGATAATMALGGHSALGEAMQQLRAKGLFSSQSHLPVPIQTGAPHSVASQPTGARTRAPGFPETDLSGPGAMRRLIYEDVDYHGQRQSGRKSPRPRHGQDALDFSLPFGDTTLNRVGIDYETRQFVVLHRSKDGLFHGHVRNWKGLTTAMQNVLVKYGMSDRKGNIL